MKTKESIKKIKSMVVWGVVVLTILYMVFQLTIGLISMIPIVSGIVSILGIRFHKTSWVLSGLAGLCSSYWLPGLMILMPISIFRSLYKSEKKGKEA